MMIELNNQISQWLTVSYHFTQGGIKVDVLLFIISEDKGHGNEKKDDKNSF